MEARRAEKYGKTSDTDTVVDQTENEYAKALLAGTAK